MKKHTFYLLTFSMFIMLFTCCKSDDPVDDNKNYTIRAQVENPKNCDVDSVEISMIYRWDSENYEDTAFIIRVPYVNNQFTVTLPDNLHEKYLIPALDFIYIDSLKISNRDAKITVGTYIHFHALHEGNRIGGFDYSDASPYEIDKLTAMFIYADRSFNVKGSYWVHYFDVEGIPSSFHIENYSYKKGWNCMYYKATFDDNGAATFTTLVNQHTELKWYLYSNYECNQ